MTPNLLARTMETVEGGGIIVLLLRTLTSLKQLYTMTMDVHARYRTEAHQEVTARFNERFLLSLADCPHCLVMDDQLNVLPMSSTTLHITPITPSTKVRGQTLFPETKCIDTTCCIQDEPTSLELTSLKESLADTQPVGSLVTCCKTLDQVSIFLAAR